MDRRQVAARGDGERLLGEVRLAQVGAHLVVVEVRDLEQEPRDVPVGLPGRPDPPGSLAELDRHRQELRLARVRPEDADCGGHVPPLLQRDAVQQRVVGEVEPLAGDLGLEGGGGPRDRLDVGIGERHLRQELLEPGARQRLEDPRVGAREPLPPEHGVGVEQLAEIVEADDLSGVEKERVEARALGSGEEGVVQSLVVRDRPQGRVGRDQLLVDAGAGAHEPDAGDHVGGVRRHLGRGNAGLIVEAATREELRGEASGVGLGLGRLREERVPL